jgi:hypothetical protein
MLILWINLAKRLIGIKQRYWGGRFGDRFRVRHTAGAIRIGRAVRDLLGEVPATILVKMYGYLALG